MLMPKPQPSGKPNLARKRMDFVLDDSGRGIAKCWGALARIMDKMDKMDTRPCFVLHLPANFRESPTKVSVEVEAKGKT